MLRSNAKRQTSINAICSYLVSFKIRSTHDLRVNLTAILEKINKDPKIFVPTDTFFQRTAIFNAAVEAYSQVSGYKIKTSDRVDWILFNENKIISDADSKQISVAGILIQQDDKPQESAISDHKDAAALEIKMVDLFKVTQSYDQLVDAIKVNNKKNQQITDIIMKIAHNNELLACDSIIFGAGDTGTTLWLEKYKAQHATIHQSILKRQLPNVLMIAENFGSWKHDYTLAQTQSSLERSNAVKNPGDFLPMELYQENPQANARHVFQANHVCLSKTHAPILMAKMLKIEKRENHDRWESDEHLYRCFIQLPNGSKTKVYMHNIDICTGLGPPNLDFERGVIKQDLLKKLNQFDEKLGFTPIVDGNQYVLSPSEEEKDDRSIVIYGGGGTASACYRKSFFGTDIRTYNRPFTPENQKNSVIWVYRDFIGTGRMAENALNAAQERKAVLQGKLVNITQRRDGKLHLTFKMLDSKQGPATKKLVCSQLIYSIGQDDGYTKQICKEVSSGLQLNHDPLGMLLYVSSKDKRINFFGASAVSFYKTAFNEQTMRWLTEQNIGGDVGPGSMPPTRAQVKRHLALQGAKPESINANMDTSDLINEFLLDAKVDKDIADVFIADLLLARKDHSYGCARITLEKLLKKYQLDKILDVFGHSHLVIKGKQPIAQQVLVSNLSLLSHEKISSPCVIQDDNYFRPLKVC